MSEYQKTEYPRDNCYGRVWINRDKQKPNANPRLPDKTGNIEIDGNPHKVSIWVNQDNSETMKARPMTPTERENYFAKKGFEKQSVRIKRIRILRRSGRQWRRQK